MKRLAGNLKFLRKSRKLTQEDIYNHLSISRATWSNYENKVSEPNIDTLIEIAKYFNVRIDEMLLTDLSIREKENEGADIWNEIKALRKDVDELKREKGK